MDECSSELIEGEEDEEGIDQMNDLTFGGNNVYEEDEDGDWEAHHEKLAENLGYGLFQGSHPAYDDHRRRLGLDDDDTLFEAYDVQGELEDKLNQLVVDEDDEDEPDEANHTRRDIPHPRKSIDLDNLFGPSSPPGLFHAEDIVSGHTNIWGSPMRMSYLPENNVVQDLLKAIHMKNTLPGNVSIPPTTGQLFHAQRAMTLEEVEQELLHRPPRSNESLLVKNVENGARYDNGTDTDPSRAWDAGPSNLLTVEELERRFQVESGSIEDMPPAPPSGHYVGEMPPPLASGHYIVNPSQSVQSPYAPPPTLSDMPDLPRHPGILHLPPNMSEMMHFQKMTQAMGPPPPGLPPPSRIAYPMPHPGDQHMNMGRWPTNSRGMMMPRLPGFGPFPYNYVPPPGYRPPPPFFNQGNDRNKHPSMMHQRQYFPAGFGDSSFARSASPHCHSMPPPSQYIKISHGGGGTRIPPPTLINTNYPLYSQQHFQQLQMLRHMSAQGLNTGRGGYPHPQNYGGGGVGRGQTGGRDDGDEDDYAGLMEQRERDWVVKIQLLQLHTDNPYVDDYYYTCWSMKKMLREKQLRDCIHPQNSKPEDEPTLVLPQLAKSDAKAYAPVQFEGSLGRLTASSIHNPRRMIDLHSSAPPDQDEAKRWELRRFRQTMLNIEKCYVALLDVDDIEKRALAQPPENRSALFDERRKLITYLYDSLHLSDAFPATLGKDSTSTLSQLMLIRKGILLIARLLPLVERTEAETIVCALIHKLPQLTKKEWHDEVWPRVYQSVSRVIKSSDLRALVLFASQLGHDSSEITLNKNRLNSMTSVMQNKLGVSIITCLLSRGEVVYTTHSPLDMDTADQQQWRSFVESVAMALDNTEKDFVVRPTENFDNVLSHFHRILDKRWLLAIEDKLNNILPPSTTLSVSPTDKSV